jgi:hypothetical protein
MKKIIVTVNKSAALEEWKMKEEGSFEDHKMSESHVFAILSRFGHGKTVLTEQEAKTVLTSGNYHKEAWTDDEIVGGATTKKVIARICEKIASKL